MNLAYATPACGRFQLLTRVRAPFAYLLAALLGALAGCNPPPTEPPSAGTLPSTIASQPLAPTSLAGATGQAVPLSLGASSNRAVGAPEVVLGTGQFVNRVGTATSAPPVTLVGSDVSLDFAGVDVRDVLKTVLGDLLQVSYAIDPAVQGTITLQTGKPIPRSSVIDVLSTTLQFSGIGLVLRDSVYLAVPIANAVRQAQLGGGAGFVTRIVPLQYVAAGELERTLEPLIPVGATLKADQSRNILIISGSARDVASIQENIATFDADFLRGLSFALLPLRSGRARDVANDVTKLIAAAGRSMTDMVKVVPIERANAVLVTSAQPSYLQRVQSWVERFDRGDGRAEPQLFVYRVQNGRATDLAAVLRRALGLQSANAGRGGPDAGGGVISPDQQGMQPDAGSTAASGLDIVQSTLSGVPPANAAPPGSPQLRSDPLAGVATIAAAGGGTAPLMPDVRVTADQTNNAVIITATAQDYAPIEAALHKLDLPPLQVLIEATVAEVTLKDQLSFGLQYFINSGRFHAIFAPGVPPATQQTPDPTAFFPNFPGLGFLQGFNIGYGTLDNHVVLQTLAGLTTVRVLSSPNLLVLNNGTARLQVGDQVAIATQSATSTLTNTAQTVNSISYKDTGVILNVTPRVNASGLVLLDLSEEVSQPTAPFTPGLNSPTISQRRVNSSIAVHDGQTIGLAGLIQDNKTNSNSGLPWLKDIPVIGALFGVRSDSTTRTELLVLITPRVMRNRDEGDTITRELRQKLRLTVPVAARAR